MNMHVYLKSCGLALATFCIVGFSANVRALALNHNYQVTHSPGAENMQPTNVFDDGKATWFVLPTPTDSVPLIAIVGDDGRESTPSEYFWAPSANNKGISITAVGIAQHWRLRHGDKIVDINNMSFKASELNYTQPEKNNSKDSKLQDDIKAYLVKLNSLSPYIEVGGINVDVHPNQNLAFFSFARFTKSAEGIVKYEKIHGNLTYQYVTPPDDSEQMKRDKILQVKTMEIKTEGNEK